MIFLQCAIHFYRRNEDVNGKIDAMNPLFLIPFQLIRIVTRIVRKWTDSTHLQTEE